MTGRAAAHGVARRRVVTFAGGRVRAFLSGPGPAFDLAVFRVVYYATALALLFQPLSQTRRYAGLPESLRTSPDWFGPVAGVLPVSPGLVTAAFTLLVVTSVTGALGAWTRTSATVFALTLFYYLTVPQLYGKVNHTHLVLWVAVLLAVSRTADTWSVDAVRRSLRGREPAAAPADSVAYSRPLRAVWLLLGLSYLFPGLMKLARVGPGWASPQNLRGYLYARWYELGGYHPPLPVDHDALLWAMGLGTLFFEVTFVVWILDPRTRWLSPAMGLVFHNGTWVAMRIGFFSSQVLYAAFVPWSRLTARLLGRRPPVALPVHPGCGGCERLAAAVVRLSLPGAVTTTGGAGHLAPPDVRAAARRSPAVLALLGPARRAVHGENGGGTTPGPDAGRATGALVTAGTITALTLVAAATNTVDGWPVAIYPTFAYDARAHRTSTLAVAVAGRPLDLAACLPWMPPDRRRSGLLAVAAKPPPGRDRALRDLLTAMGRDCAVSPAQAAQVTVDRITVSDDPGSFGAVVARSRLLPPPP